jgi:hypothetical protein
MVCVDGHPTIITLWIPGHIKHHKKSLVGGAINRGFNGKNIY